MAYRLPLIKATVAASSKARVYQIMLSAIAAKAGQ
jgi:hypothetical protein